MDEPDEPAEYAFLHFPADAIHVDRVTFGKLPASARRVFEVVRDHGPLTHAAIHEHTDMPPRTIRFAIKRLRDEGLLDTRCSLRDCRTCYFFVDKRCVGLEALEEARRKAQEAAADGRLIEPA